MNLRPSGDPIAAIKEKEAEGEIAALFSKIRSSLGTSSVNLIWRHLATFPGALPWCWKAVTPLLEDGALHEEARDFREGLKGLQMPQMPTEVQQVLGLRPDDMALIESTVRGYYVSCTMNILSLNALLVRMNEPQTKYQAAEFMPQRASGQDTPLEQMARLLDPIEMPPHVANLVWLINSLGGDGRILASLFRYLANWPSFLGATWTIVAPLAETGQLDAAVAEGLADVDIRARRLAVKINPPSAALDVQTQRAIHDALEEFGRNALAKSIPVARVLLMLVGSQSTIVSTNP